VDVTDPDNSITRPRIDVVRALPPEDLTVVPTGCYGRTITRWDPHPESGMTYYLEVDNNLDFTSPTLAYSGTKTRKVYEVTETSYFRVRACEGGRCSGWNESTTPAPAYPTCQ
jgi:hypothetical protein